MRDIDVRLALRSQVLKKHYSDAHSRVIEELGVCEGIARIDIAVVNGLLHGYEIKSEQDTLTRLPQQIDHYGRVFDKVTLVVGERHLSAASDEVPSWWGISVVRTKDQGHRVIKVRGGKMNPKVDPYHLAQLLWRDEALVLLEALGRAKGMASKPRSEIWAALATAMPLRALRQAVRDTLRTRKDWLLPAQQS